MPQLNGQYFPAHTLEGQLASALEHIEIQASLIRQGKETATHERLSFIAIRVQDALQAQTKIEKRDAAATRKRAQAAAENFISSGHVVWPS